VIIADPCFSSLSLICKFGEKYQTFTKLTTLINTLLSEDSFSYYQILGDNFYDLTGSLGKQFMSAIDVKVKSKVFGTTIGNHDINIFGTMVSV
jgi:hypothetical protein